MKITKAQLRFLEDHYGFVHRWAHYNDVHLQVHRRLDPQASFGSPAIDFEPFVTYETMLTGADCPPLAPDGSYAFLAANYPLIHRWVHHNDIKHLTRISLDPVTVPWPRDMEFKAFSEYEARCFEIS